MLRRLLLLMMIPVVFGACDVVASFNGNVRGGWVWPTPVPRPAGATAVPIRVTPIPDPVPQTDAFACAAALLAPVRMHVDRSSSPHAVTYQIVATGQPIVLEWSWGVSAYELDGRVRIVAPDGRVLMTEGEIASDIGGGGGNNPTVFAVCDFSSLPRRADVRAAG